MNNYFPRHFSEAMPKNKLIIDKAMAIKQRINVAVINPLTADSLQGALLAAEKGLAQPLLIGIEAQIRKLADELHKNISKFEIVPAEDDVAAAKIAVNLAHEGKVQALMRGHIATSTLMQAALDKETGIRTKRRASHCLLMDAPSYDKIMICTDPAINVAPDLATKKSIIENAVEFAYALDITNPQVALLSFVETVMEDVAATTDAAVLCKMANRGQITGCVLDGPLSVDLAISKEAILAKDFSPVLTAAPDIFVFPDLNSANIAVKIIDYLAGGQSGGLVVGLKVPIILMRRSSPAIEHTLSFALAKLYCLNK